MLDTPLALVLIGPDSTSSGPKLPLTGADGKVVKDAKGKTRMVETCAKIAQSGAPQEPGRSPAGDKRSTSTHAEGRKTETVEVRPSVPPAH